MKITRTTPDLLIAQEIPWFIAVMLSLGLLLFVGVGLLVSSQTLIGAFVMGGIGGGMCFAAICIFVERLQIILDARAGTATLRARTILRSRETVFALQDLLGATGESTLSGGTTSDDPARVRRKLHRPSLVLSDGAGGEVLHPITEIYDSSSTSGTVVRAINDWLTQLRCTDAAPPA
ncbi:hypothetical protein [uncultured Roseovarius sp.]|uniref:hypothetical protein n=1 Tax=uncultured Roseovarius sp. TaxID=293344 RepID=UPI0026089D2B|nr:hypothetical protein [uncultured Roseovarius sp.]